MLLIKSLFIVIYLSLVTCYPQSKRSNHIEPSTILPNYSYYPRADWNAFIAKRILIDSHEPISLVVVKHTNSPYCYRKLACAKSMKKLQHQFMKNGFNDIQYNFVIDPHGNVFEGLGWFSLGTDKSNQNYRTIGFIGMENTKITSKQEKAVTDLFKEGLMLKILNKNYHFYGTTYLAEAMKNIKINLQVKMDTVEDVSMEELYLNDAANEQDYEVQF